MKNKLKLFGFMALVAVVGFSMVACDDGDDSSIVGTWTGSFYYIPDEAETGFNVTIKLVFKSNGKGTITESIDGYDDTSISFDWSQSDSTVTYTVEDNEPVPFTFNGGNSFTIGEVEFTRK